MRAEVANMRFHGAINYHLFHLSSPPLNSFISLFVMLPLDTKTEMFISLLGIARAVKKLLHIFGIFLKNFLCRALAFFFH